MARYGSLPFKEQISFFSDKIPVPTRGWADVYGAEHDRAFMVAGIARMDVLADLQDATRRAAASGIGLREFRSALRKSQTEKGWAFPGDFHQRSRLIYQTNMRSSYAAGREAQMADPALREAMPYKLYRHGGSRDPRPEHLSWDGLVLRADDPWWDTHSPPNGWGCSCRSFLLDQAAMDRMGLQLGSAPSVEMRTVTVGQRSGNPRTVQVPVGIDPSFEHRPGASALGDLAQLYVSKAADLPAEAGAAAVLGVLSRQRLLAALSAQHSAWIDEVLATPATNRTVAWGALTPAAVRAAAEANIALESAVLLTRDVEIKRARRDPKVDARRADGSQIALSVDDLKRLPEFSANPRATLLEQESRALLLVFDPPGGEREAGKLIVRVNFRQKVGTPAGARKITGNFFRSGGYVTLEDLRKDVRAGILQLLDGGVGE